MSENFQTKPDQLVPTVPSSVAGQKLNDVDDMFSGMGLDNYVKKKDTAALATGLMSNQPDSNQQTFAETTPSFNATSTSQLSLEDKKRLVQQTEAQKRMRDQPQLMPNSISMGSLQQKNASGSVMTGQSGPTDLTSTLMQKNLSQMKSSTSHNTISAFQSGTQFGSQSAASSGLSDAGWGNFAQPMSYSQPVSNSGPKPDLSAFDSLLSMPSSNQRTSMNAMATKARPTASALPAHQTMIGSTVRTSPQFSTPTAQPSQNVKSLTANDISDLLS